MNSVTQMQFYSTEFSFLGSHGLHYNKIELDSGSSSIMEYTDNLNDHYSVSLRNDIS